jgi:hypothetical protein
LALGVTMTDMQPLVNRLNAASGQVPGGGGGTMTGMISGTATKGAVGGATVTAYAVSNGSEGGPRLGAVHDRRLGNVSVPLGSYGGQITRNDIHQRSK